MYLEARSGIARSGVTYAGWAPPNVQVFIGGVNRIDNVDAVGFRITQALDGAASTCQLTLSGYTPTFGQRVMITYASPDQYLFVGTILRIQGIARGASPDAVLWQCTSMGDTWLMDRYARVTKQYHDRGVGSIVADILATFTDGGFRIGYIPSSLGNLTLEFTFEPVTSAIDRIAKAVDGYWEIDPGTKCVSIFDTYPDAALFPITNNPAIRVDSFGGDLSQVRTRVLFQGVSTPTSAPVAALATTVPVQDTAIFPPSGQAFSGFSVMSYTGRTTQGGPGSLTGVTGLAHDLAEGDDVALLVDEGDAAAQAALAAVLGGGLSGIATHVIAKDDASAVEASERARADIALFKSAMTELTYGTISESHRHVRAGRLQSVTLTAPFTISDTFRVQSVTIVRVGGLKGRTVNLERQVSLSRFQRSLTTILARGV